MDLYTLTDSFLRDKVVDTFVSAIWTERYGSEGDTILVVSATPENISNLKPGTFLSLEGTNEVMLLETQSIKDGNLTVQGYSLLKFLDNRLVRYSANNEEHALNVFVPSSPLWLANTIVREMCTDSNWTDGTYPNGLFGVYEIIPGLTVPDPDLTGEPTTTISVPFGTVLAAVKALADTYSLGIRLYLSNANEEEYSLIFVCYRGRDLTSDQEIYPMVRFSSLQGSLTNVSEIDSISGYKNIAYAFASAIPGDDGSPVGVAYAGVDIGTLVGFERRTMMVFCDDLTDETLASDPSLLQDILNQRAVNALANNNYTRVIDGEVVPQSEYRYGVNYKLGDVIELQGNSGLVKKARISEYIRSQDENGSREYPTISIVD